MTKALKVLLALVVFAGQFSAVEARGKKFAEKGDIVKVNYTGRLADGRIFDTSEGAQPLEFIAGAGQMIKGFDAAILGMKKKEQKTVKIPAAEAYGLVDETRIVEIDKSKMPASVELKPGSKLNMNSPTGQSFPVRIVDVSEEVVTIDANHSLAGKDLIFDIELISVEAPKKAKK